MQVLFFAVKEDIPVWVAFTNPLKCRGTGKSAVLEKIIEREAASRAG
jgi:hypothetical protein